MLGSITRVRLVVRAWAHYRSLGPLQVTMTKSAFDLQRPTDDEFELLQTIAALTGELSRPPTLSEVSGAYESPVHKSKTCTRQWAGARVKRLRSKGFVEEQPGRNWPGVILTHNGKLALETGLGAGLKE